MKEKPKRFSISLPPELAERLRATQTDICPQLSQREIMETLIRKGLEETEKTDKERDPSP